VTPRLLANENFPLPATKLLREAGVDVAAVAEIMPGSADEEVLDLARREGRWLVTYDRDYGELVFSRGLAAPPAILYLRQAPYSPTRPAELVLNLLAQPENVERFLVVVSERSIRRRRLPQT
jgi:predicted nuclease of predicted toxin-antitoxin system